VAFPSLSRTVQEYTGNAVDDDPLIEKVCAAFVPFKDAVFSTPLTSSVPSNVKNFS
jgi:hypothetical protein